MSAEEFINGSRRLYLAPEHGGDIVSGGGHPSDAPESAQEAVSEAFDQNATGGGSVPSWDDISRRAQEIWDQEGRPDGKSEEHWLRAETELRAR